MRLLPLFFLSLFYGCNPAIAAFVPNEFICNPTDQKSLENFRLFVDSEAVQKLHFGSQTFDYDLDSATLFVPARLGRVPLCFLRNDKTIFCETFGQTAIFQVNQYNNGLIIPSFREIGSIGIINLRCKKR